MVKKAIICLCYGAFLFAWQSCRNEISEDGDLKYDFTTEQIVPPEKQADPVLEKLLSERTLDGAAPAVWQYAYHWSDLNSDGLQDVLLADFNACTNKGCGFMIFQQERKGGFRMLKRMSDVRFPVIFQKKEQSEWADLYLRTANGPKQLRWTDGQYRLNKTQWPKPSQQKLYFKHAYQSILTFLPRQSGNTLVLAGICREQNGELWLKECSKPESFLIKDTPDKELLGQYLLFDDLRDQVLWVELEGRWASGQLQEKTFLLKQTLKVERRDAAEICR